MQIYDFTAPELTQLRELCNFSDDELEYFNLRAKHKSNTFRTINKKQGHIFYKEPFLSPLRTKKNRHYIK